MSKVDRSELRSVIVWAVLIVLLASIPYLWGAFITPPGYRFLGLTQNIDDGAVYLSWTRQAADGHFFLRNLFTNEPQSGLQINLLFLAMGRVARLAGISCLASYHLFRVLLGIGLILAIYRFTSLGLTERRERLLLIPLVGLSSGIGWLIPHVQSPVGSVDIWQPEAITFLSLYLNPLFLAGLILMLGTFHNLLQADSTGRAKNAVYAGICLLLLANIHSYDVITVACVWLAYIVVRAVVDRKLPTRLILHSVLAALIASPAIAWQFHIYLIDPVYRLRANTPIPSPPIWSYFEGYGLILAAAIAGAALLIKQRRNTQYPILNTQLLVLVWAIVGFAMPYLPLAQGRKLIMGLHIPLCILAVLGISWLISRLRPAFGVCVAAAVVLITCPTNAWFLKLDMSLLGQGRTVTRYAPYMSEEQVKIMESVGRETKPSDTILCSPQLALFVPAYSGRQVYCGHWSETPNYDAKLAQWVEFADPTTPMKQKQRILKQTKATYVILDAPLSIRKAPQ